MWRTIISLCEDGDPSTSGVAFSLIHNLFLERTSRTIESSDTIFNHHVTNEKDEQGERRSAVGDLADGIYRLLLPKIYRLVARLSHIGGSPVLGGIGTISYVMIYALHDTLKATGHASQSRKVNVEHLDNLTQVPIGR